MCDAGVMLGFCALVQTASTANFLRREIFSRLSSHSDAVLEKTSFVLGASLSSSSLGYVSATKHGLNRTCSLDDGFAAPNFGVVSGGSVGRPAPSGDSGHVKMWNLEAIHRVVAYILDEPHAKPLDISNPPDRRVRNFGGKLPSRLRKA